MMYIVLVFSLSVLMQINERKVGCLSSVRVNIEVLQCLINKKDNILKVPGYEK